MYLPGVTFNLMSVRLSDCNVFRLGFLNEDLGFLYKHPETL